MMPSDLLPGHQQQTVHVTERNRQQTVARNGKKIPDRLWICKAG